MPYPSPGRRNEPPSDPIETSARRGMAEEAVQIVLSSRDFFELFEMPRRFAVDDALVCATYKRLARRVHPDAFAGQSPELVLLATRACARLNDAYETVRDPVRRGAYLLELAGGPAASEVRDVPGDLLANVMMLREELEEARDDDGTEPTPSQSLRAIREQVEEQRATLLQQIQSAADDLPTADEGQRKQFRTLLNAIKYYDNLATELTDDPLTP